jgi:hypothetical protein
MRTSPPVLPVGTKVLVRTSRRVGVIQEARAPGRYEVKFPEGQVETFSRSGLTIFRHELEELAGEIDPETLRPFIQYVCVVGSRAYGLESETSDTDRRGFFLPPADLHWSLAAMPEQIEDEQEQECYWELEKFLRLALKANPNVLETLYSPLRESVSPLAEELLAMRASFLSRAVHQTYNGYVLSQFKKMEQDLRQRGEVSWKHAMHLVRLLLSGITVLREGFVPLRVDGHRDRLLAVKRGEMPWEDVERWRLELHREFDAALAATALPERPDYPRVNRFLLRARRSAL